MSKSVAVDGSRAASTQPSAARYSIRPAVVGDLPALYKVCLKTGDGGRDATAAYPKYPNTLGERWVGGYVALPGCVAFALVETTGPLLLGGTHWTHRAPDNDDDGCYGLDEYWFDVGGACRWQLDAEDGDESEAEGTWRCTADAVEIELTSVREREMDKPWKVGQAQSRIIALDIFPKLYKKTHADDGDDAGESGGAAATAVGGGKGGGGNNAPTTEAPTAEVVVVGYTLAALDSSTFYPALLADWLPTQASQYPKPTKDGAGGSTSTSTTFTEEEKSIVELYEPSYTLSAVLATEFPAHLHIDIMEQAQRKGNGRVLINTLLASLKSHGVKGVHLEMHRSNVGALAFYTKLGFQPVDVPGLSESDPMYLGIKLL